MTVALQDSKGVKNQPGPYTHTLGAVFFDFDWNREEALEKLKRFKAVAQAAP
jgi:hypothetical protein